MENLKINKKSEQTTATYTKGGYREHQYEYLW